MTSEPRKEVLSDGIEIWLGDCREVLPLIGRVDTVVTSPPYNCGKDYGEFGDNLEVSAYILFLKNTVFSALAERLCVNVANYFGSRADRVRTQDVVFEAARPWPLIDEIIWDKGPANGAAWGNYPTSPRIRAQHENIYIYGSNRLSSDSGITWPEWSALTTSIWRISANVDLSIHPAMMPVTLADRLVRLYSPHGSSILDPFMGSGTTGVACVNLGRKFIGIEREPKYYDIARRRINEALSRPRLPFDEPIQVKQEALF